MPTRTRTKSRPSRAPAFDGDALRNVFGERLPTAERKSPALLGEAAGIARARAYALANGSAIPTREEIAKIARASGVGPCEVQRLVRAAVTLALDSVAPPVAVAEGGAP